MLKPVKIPRGIANLFAIGDCSEISIVDIWAHRPDLIMDSVGQKSMKTEIANNYMSNSSPISLKTRDKYLIMDNMFMSNFFNS